MSVGIEWRRAARVVSLLGCVLISSACGGQAGSEVGGEPNSAGTGAAGHAGQAGGAAGASNANGAAGASNANGAAGASNANGATCQPGAACGGLSTCTDQCYGDRCCYLGCWCDDTSQRLECSLSCN